MRLHTRAQQLHACKMYKHNLDNNYNYSRAFGGRRFVCWCAFSLVCVRCLGAERQSIHASTYRVVVVVHLDDAAACPLNALHVYTASHLLHTMLLLLYVTNIAVQVLTRIAVVTPPHARVHSRFATLLGGRTRYDDDDHDDDEMLCAPGESAATTSPSLRLSFAEEPQPQQQQQRLHVAHLCGRCARAPY